MAEIGEPENLVPEGFRARFVKTEGFWEGNSKILQLIKGNTHFLLIFLKNGSKFQLSFHWVLKLYIRTSNVCCGIRLKTEGFLVGSRGI